MPQLLRGSSLLVTYQRTRLNLALIGGAFSLATGMLVGRDRWQVLLLVSAAVAGHALLSLRGSLRTTEALFMDGILLGVVTAALGNLSVTIVALGMFVTVGAILSPRRRWRRVWVFAVVVFGISGAVSRAIDPPAQTPLQTAVAEGLAITFFMIAIVGLTTRLIWDLRTEAALREKAEAEREASERRFRTMIQRSHDGIVIIGARGDVRYASESYGHLTGFDPEERVGSAMTDHVHPDDIGRVEEAFADLLARPGGTAAMRLRTMRADGVWRWIDANAVNLLHEPTIEGILVNFRDVTEGAEAEEALRETNSRLQHLNRSKDQFIAAVSHELRTPLTAVVGLAEELAVRGNAFGPAEVEEFHRVIAGQAREVAAIVEDLLVAARADIGEVAIRLERLDLARLAGTTVRSLGARVDVLADDPVEVIADGTRVRQIIRNLVTNAVRYGGPLVRLEVLRRDERGVLRVFDNGREIPMRDRDRIFEPYERAHERPTQPASIGLGLTVSRRLARMMGGELSYRWEEGWSVFELGLPLASSVSTASEAVVIG